MTPNWKWFRTVTLIALLSLSAAGCSGIHATKSISILDFLLPGITKKDVPAAHGEPGGGTPLSLAAK